MSAGKLQLTNGYSVDFGEIARFVSTVQRDGRAKIPLADIANAGGFALRQAENLGSISQAFGLVEPRVLRLLPLGKITAAHDRFFDDVGTLWFLHYVIASQPRHIVWNRFATDLVIRPGGFTKDEFNGAFGDLAVTHSASSANKHVRKETRGVVDAYLNQKLARLSYLREEDERFSLSYREPLPPLILAACIAEYRDRHRPGDTAVAVPDLLSGPNSPGVICQIPEDRLRIGLEGLKNEAGVSLESRADLDQIRLSPDIAGWKWMERYYVAR